MHKPRHIQWCEILRNTEWRIIRKQALTKPCVVSCLSPRRYSTKEAPLKYDTIQILVTTVFSATLHRNKLTLEEACTHKIGKMKYVTANSKKKSFHQEAKESFNCCQISYKDFNLFSQKLNYSPYTPEKRSMPGVPMKPTQCASQFVLCLFEF